VSILGLRTAQDGTVNPASDFNQQVEMVGSLDGLYFSQDKVIVTAGRRADPHRASEVMVSDQTAQHFGLHVGQVLDVNLYTKQQWDNPDTDPDTARPARRARLTITGIGVFTDEVVQDDVDRIYRVLATPALTRQALSCCAGYAWVGLQLDQGDRAVPAAQREFARLLPPGWPLGFRVTSVAEGQGERAIRPESVAAAVFGLIAALAAVVLAGQAIRRCYPPGAASGPCCARWARARGPSRPTWACRRPARSWPGPCWPAWSRWRSRRWRRSGRCTVSTRSPGSPRTGPCSAPGRPCCCSCWPQPPRCSRRPRRRGPQAAGLTGPGAAPRAARWPG
jgi:hypothetical protein